MNISNRWGFTLVEIISVVVILWTLATALYIGTVPYMKRSRDTKRIVDIWSYLNILDAYDKNFDTYPSNYWSGWSLILGYCLSEIYKRPDYVWYPDMKFQALWSWSTQPPHDPSFLPPITPCDMTGSYLYSRLDYGVSSQMALIAARLEMQTTANYWTWSDLILTSSIESIKSAKKWFVPLSAPDSLYVVYRLK